MRCGIISEIRKTNSGYGRSLDRNTGHLIDWECGRRDKEALEKLTTRLVSTCNVKIYYTDKGHVYPSVLPVSKLVQTKAETHRIEHNNCRMKHYFGRFKQKSIIVSKSVEMVDLTIALFARFRVNGNVFDILNIGGGQPNIISSLIPSDCNTFVSYAHVKIKSPIIFNIYVSPGKV